MDNLSEKLFAPLTLNNQVTVKNRLCVAPLTLFAGLEDGRPSEEECRFLNGRGKDIGLYVLGATGVKAEGLAFIGQPRAFSSADLDALRQRASLIKKDGALAIVQLHHAGAQANPALTKCDPHAPSLVPDWEGPKLHVLTVPEIKSIIEAFAKATELAIESGYDGVELHGANNYLLQQFYSAHTNQRTDEYGGSTDEERMRFILEVVDAVVAVRERLNRPDFIIGYRLSPEEPYPDGLTMDNTLKLVKVLSQKTLQYLHVSQWNFLKQARRGQGTGSPRLELIHKAVAGKMALVGCGGLHDQESFEQAVTSGYAELYACGNAIMLNPQLGTLLKEGRYAEIETALDPEKPENYRSPQYLWQMCCQNMGWLPAVKGKEHQRPDA